MNDLLESPYIGDRSLRVPSKYLYGLYEGRVEDVEDPRNSGRMRVRIFGVHSNDQGTETLPWALPSFAPNQFSVPQVGEIVWCGFRQGHPDFPVWMGMVYGINSQPSVKGRHPGVGRPGVKQTKLNAANRDTVPPIKSNNSRAFLMPAGNTAPEETFQDKQTGEPNVHVIWKSPKGHTIYANDDDEHEKLVIVDRAGQILEFICPVTADKNISNASSRGRGEASSDTQLPLDAVVGKETKVRLTDAGGHFLEFTASGNGKSQIELRSLENGYFKIEEDGQKVTIHAEDGSGSTLTMDKDMVSETQGVNQTFTESGDATLTAQQNITLDAQQTITVKNPSASVTLEPTGTITATNTSGATVELGLTGDVTITGPISVSITGGTSVDVTGGTVSITGGSVTITGMVAIN